jgi:hypothetical protein
VSGLPAGDRSFLLVLARTWHVVWMRTTGAAMPAEPGASGSLDHARDLNSFWLLMAPIGSIES